MKPLIRLAAKILAAPRRAAARRRRAALRPRPIQTPIPYIPRRRPEEQLGTAEHAEMYMDNEIIAEARRHINKNGGQCKIFIQTVVKTATGVFPPKNHTTEKWRWNLSHSTKAYERITEKRIDTLSDIRTGMILQILWDKAVISNRYNWHSAIVTKVTDDEIHLIDSNFNGGETCREHIISREWLAKAVQHDDHGSPLITAYYITRTV